MRHFGRFLLALVLFAALLGVTGLVLARHARMAGFLRARDRIEQGEDRQAVLRDLASGAPREAGPFRLTREAEGALRLFERSRYGWREVR